MSQSPYVFVSSVSVVYISKPERLSQQRDLSNLSQVTHGMHLSMFPTCNPRRTADLIEYFSDMVPLRSSFAGYLPTEVYSTVGVDS